MDDEDDPPGAPLPPEDRLWRHPSEVGAAAVPSRPPRRGRTLITVGVVSGLAGAAVAVLSLAALGTLGTGSTVERVSASTVPPTTVRGATAIATAAAPAVVEVSVVTVEGVRRGSGVMARSDGLVLTSARLVDQAETLRVRWADGVSVAAELAGIDAVTGLAAVTVGDGGHPTPTFDLTPPEPGDRTFAVGAGRDGSEPIVRTGVVAATDARPSLATGVLVELIETDAPVGDEVDGGALLDDQGNLRGVCIAVGDGDEGWAVPADVAVRVADDLRRLGRVDRGWLGVAGTRVLGDAPVPSGFVVEEVASGSPAERVGLRVGDVVIAVGDDRVRSLDDIRGALTLTRPGQTITVEAARGGATLSVDVTLATAP